MAEIAIERTITRRKSRRALLARWGLIPSWLKDTTGFPLLFNARSETAAEKAAFRAAMRHRRVLVVTDAVLLKLGTYGFVRIAFDLDRAGPVDVAVYDLRGISDTLDPDDHLFGLIQFKLGTGGEPLTLAGTYY